MANHDAAVSSPLYPLLFDPQTSGGLCGFISSEKTDLVIAQLHEAGFLGATVIGTVEKGDEFSSPRIGGPCIEIE